MPQNEKNRLRYPGKILANLSLRVTFGSHIGHCGGDELGGGGGPGGRGQGGITSSKILCGFPRVSEGFRGFPQAFLAFF